MLNKAWLRAPRGRDAQGRSTSFAFASLPFRVCRNQFMMRTPDTYASVAASLAGLPLLEKGPFDTKEIASVPPFTNHYLNPRRMVGSWLS